MFLMTPGLRQHITRRVPPTRSLAAPEKPTRAIVNRGAHMEASKGCEPGIAPDRRFGTRKRYVQSLKRVAFASDR